MITLVGAGHIFSIREAIRYIIYFNRPNAVCVELDELRYEALENQVDRYTDAPFLMKRLQKIYDKAAEVSGGELGEEMLGAVQAAKDLSIPHFFIDVKMDGMAGDIMKELSIPQMVKLAGSLIGTSILPKKQMKKAIRKVEDDTELMLDEFEKQFPSLKEKLIDDRNLYMANNIIRLHRKYPHVLAVVGAGHLKGMMELLPVSQVNIIQLKEVKSIAKKLENGELRYVPVERISGNSKIDLSYSIFT
jgi:pheromone shutdown protein TraB